MEVEYGCATCKHKKSFLVPCDWLKSKKHVIFECPHYESENPWVRINNKFDELFQKGGAEDGN